MGLEERIAQRKEELAGKWAELILCTYPPETQAVWRANTERFSNPVGRAIRTATEELIPLLLAWNDPDAVGAALTQLVKIRAVQDFPPSQAISFVFLLKKLLRQEFSRELAQAGELSDLLAFETRVDNLAVIAFDIYVSARDQVLRMRVDEVRRAHVNIVRRANMVKTDVTARRAE